MKTLWEQTIDRRRLSEAILLLYKLKEIPGRATENSITDFLQKKGDSVPRVLSPQREKELVETLAFIAAASDDPGKVAALCIEERAIRKGLVIRLAANHGDLLQVKEGFQKIARIMERVARRDTREKQEEHDVTLFEAVIKLNLNRILGRLRSRHAKLKCNFSKAKQMRPKIIPQLVERLGQLSTPNASDQVHWGELRAAVNDLQVLFAELESMRNFKAGSKSSLDIVASIVTTAHQVLGLLAVSDRSSVRRLSSTIMKLGRYRSASSNLLQAAQRYGIFANIEIQIVKYPPPPRSAYRDPDNGMMVRLRNRFLDEVNHAVVVSRLRKGHGVSEEQVLARVEHDLQRLAALDCAVHAEIQLLVDYELNPSAFAPRVICSTKKACFLCNLFFTLHGRFYIPSTHGKLYEKWVTPAAIQFLKGENAKRMADTMTRFNGAIEDTIRHALATSIKPYPNENESTMFQSAIWSASAQSHGSLTSALASVPEVPIQETHESLLQDVAMNGNRVFNSILEQQSQTSQASDQEINVNSSKTAHVEAVLTAPDVVTLPVATSNRSSADSVILDTLRPSYELERGTAIQIDFMASDPPLRVKSTRIHMTLSHEGWWRHSLSMPGEASEQESMDQSGKIYRVKLKWLDPAEQAQISAKGLNIVNLDHLTQNSGDMFDQYAKGLLMGIYMYRKSDMIFLQFSNTNHKG